VDDKHAFVGGVDFSTGRYDWHEHRVVDEDGRYWWGIDFYVPQVKKATSDNFETPDADILSNKKYFRMPWHDIQMYLTGEAALDTAFNFSTLKPSPQLPTYLINVLLSLVQRWNHHISTTSKYSGKAKYPQLTLINQTEYQTREDDKTSVDAVSAAMGTTLKRRNSNSRRKSQQVRERQFLWPKAPEHLLPAAGVSQDWSCNAEWARSKWWG